MHLPVVTEPRSPSAQLAITRLNIVLPRLSSVEHVRTCPGLSKLRSYVLEHIDEGDGDLGFSDDILDEWDALRGKLIEMRVSKATLDWKRQEFALNAIAQMHGDSVCPFEQQAIYNLIDSLGVVYDITDARVLMLARELSQQLLISMRVESVMGEEDLFPLFIGKNGARIATVHPSLKAKAEYSKLLVDTLKALDDMTRDRLSITVEGSFSMANLLDRIKREPERPALTVKGEVVADGVK